MKMILYCDQHEEDYEVFEWLDENDNLCAECCVCEAETILADYEACLPKKDTHRDDVSDVI